MFCAFMLIMPILSLLVAHFACSILCNYYNRNVPLCRLEHSGVDGVTECPICYSDLEPDTMVVKVSSCECKLVYCPECFDKWERCGWCSAIPPEKKTARIWKDRAFRIELIFQEIPLKSILFIISLIIISNFKYSKVLNIHL